MSYKRATITQTEVMRRVKGVVLAGIPVGKVILGPDGSVVIYAAGNTGNDDGTPNPCDRLLD